MKKISLNLYCSLLLTLTSAYAFGAGSKGGETSGGGEHCEQQIKEIRDDISAWLKTPNVGELRNLGSQSAQFVKRMQVQISKTKIKCVVEGENGFPVLINGIPKDCRFDQSKTQSRITCETGKLLAPTSTMESRYRLIFHEYVELAGYEIPNEDDSDYHIANQISAEGKMVYKVIVKRPTPETPVDISGYLLPPNSQDFGIMPTELLRQHTSCPNIEDIKNCQLPSLEDYQKDILIFEAEAPRRIAIIKSRAAIPLKIADLVRARAGVNTATEFYKLYMNAADKLFLHAAEYQSKIENILIYFSKFDSLNFIQKDREIYKKYSEFERSIANETNESTKRLLLLARNSYLRDAYQSGPNERPNGDILIAYQNTKREFFGNVDENFEELKNLNNIAFQAPGVIREGKSPMANFLGLFDMIKVYDRGIYKGRQLSLLDHSDVLERLFATDKPLKIVASRFNPPHGLYDAETNTIFEGDDVQALVAAIRAQTK